MSHNLRSQIIYAINQCTAYGESKRSASGGVSGADAGYKVYSVAYHGDLCTAAGSLAAYIRNTYPDCRRVRDITPAMLQGYLQHRADIGRDNANTLTKTISHIGKIGRCCQHVYGRCDWQADSLRLPAVTPELSREEIRTKIATDTEYSTILGAMRRPGCGQSWKAIPLARYAGLRVNECANVTLAAYSPHGGRYGCGQIVLRGKEDGCKGGRPRTVDILTPEGRDAIRDVCADVRSGQPIIQRADGGRLQADSINRAISRAVHKVLPPDQAASWRDNGCHAFRKAFAQECYNSVRMAGGTRQEAADYANQQLGHGRNRSDLTAVYIGNRW